MPVPSSIASVWPGPRPSACARPSPISTWPRTARPVAADQRRRLESRQIARVADHVDRLAERERVDALDLVARRGGLHPGDPPDRGGIARRQRGGQLVALAERAWIGLERAQLGGQRQQQQHEPDRQAEGRDGRHQARASGEHQPRAERSQPARRTPVARPRGAARAGRRATSAPRSSETAGPRRGRHAGHAAPATAIVDRQPASCRAAAAPAPTRARAR